MTVSAFEAGVADGMHKVAKNGLVEVGVPEPMKVRKPKEPGGKKQKNQVTGMTQLSDSDIETTPPNYQPPKPRRI